MEIAQLIGVKSGSMAAVMKYVVCCEINFAVYASFLNVAANYS